MLKILWANHYIFWEETEAQRRGVTWPKSHSQYEKPGHPAPHSVFFLLPLLTTVEETETSCALTLG